MAAASKTPDHPASVRVYPKYPERYPDEYVPGVGLDGAELPWDEAQAWLDAGLVVKSPPKPEPEE